MTSLLFAAAVLFAGLLIPAPSFAADSGIPDDFEPISDSSLHFGMRDVFETETITVTGIRVVAEGEDGAGNVVRTDPAGQVSFRIFNTTTQETEGIVGTVMDGEGRSFLPDLELKKNHDYIFFVVCRGGGLR